MRRGTTNAMADVGLIWAAALLTVLVGAGGANLVFKIPLAQVVDVILAAEVAVVALAELYFGVRLLSDVAAGRRAGPRLAGIIVAPFVLAPTLLALYGFAYLRGEPLAGASVVYDQVIRALGAIFQFPAQLGSAAIVAATHGGGYVSYVDKIKSVLEAVYYGLGILISIPALRAVFSGRRRETDAAAHM